MDNPVSDKSRIEREVTYLMGNEVPLCSPQSRIEEQLAWLIEHGAVVTRGYYHNGSFYKDAEHTEPITPSEGAFYYDRTGKNVYYYNGTAFVSFGGGGASTWGGITDKPFESVGDNLKVINGSLKVDVATDVQEDNTRPITSAAVYTEVGNINALLALI